MSARSSATSEHEADAPELPSSGLLLVHSKREHPSHLGLRPGVVAVYINGYPYLWIIELILQRAPDVRRIQVAPCELVNVHANHRAACAARCVELVVGRGPRGGGRAGGRRGRVWEDGKLRGGAKYSADRKFLMELSGDQRALLDELLAYGVKEAEMALRYYAVRGSAKGVTQRRVAAAYGIHPNTACDNVQGVLRYLDPNHPTGVSAQEVASRLAGRIARIRRETAQQETDQLLATEPGKLLPETTLLSQYQVHAAQGPEWLLEQAELFGRLDKILETLPLRTRFILEMRFGFYGIEATQGVVGALLGLTKAAIWALEVEGMKRLRRDKAGHLADWRSSRDR